MCICCLVGEDLPVRILFKEFVAKRVFLTRCVREELGRKPGSHMDL